MRIVPLGAVVMCGALACVRSAPPPRLDDVFTLGREAVLEEAQRESTKGDRHRARVLYKHLLTRDEDDVDARAGIARLDAWEGRWDVAERSYRNLVAKSPDHDEARAELVDLLLWQHRWAEAEALLDEGLGRAPHSSPLLQRRATLRYWRGDATDARTIADQAYAIAPDDEDVQRLRENLFLNEAHVLFHGEFYPSGMPDLYGVDLGYGRRWQRFFFSAETQQLQRFAPVPGARAYNASYSLGLTYAIDAGWSVGVEGGFGAPATAIPRGRVRAFLTAPLGSRFSVSGSYAYMLYPGPLSVHSIRPALGCAFDDDTSAEVAYLLTIATAAGQTRVLHGMSITAERQIGPIVRLRAGYAHGAEVEQVPDMVQLLTLVTDAGWLGASLRATSWLGFNPLYRIEVWSRDTAPPTVVHALELGASARW